VKPFYQPDFIITPQKNLTVEQRDDKPKAEKRLQLIKKTDSVIVEIKFAQDTNSSFGRKTVSKLTELKHDYEDRLGEGHKWIILVLVEKGEESYLSRTDLRIDNKYRNALVKYNPKKSRFD
jgi:predicted metallo-beta-lactamase superfamily hydrolase